MAHYLKTLTPDDVEFIAKRKPTAASKHWSGVRLEHLDLPGESQFVLLSVDERDALCDLARKYQELQK